LRWKYFLVFCALFLLLSPAFSESETELTVPDLIPTEEYVMTGQDIMTLYQTVKDLNETKTEYKNLTDEMMTTLNDVQTLAQEYASENQKLVLSNNFLIGTTVCSVGIVVAGVITLVVMNVN
jgi:hypothetical protein